MPDTPDTLISAAEVERRFSGLVYPVLKTFHGAADTPLENLGAIEKRYLDTFEATLKYVAALLIARYRADGTTDAKVEEELQKLARPSIGTVAGLVREVLRIYRASEDPFLAALRRSFEDPLEEETFSRLRALSELLDYPTPRKANSLKQLIDVLVVYRNRGLSHVAAAKEEELLFVRLPALGRLLAALLESWRFALQAPLVEVQGFHETAQGAAMEARVWNGLLPKRERRAVGGAPKIGHLVTLVPGKAEGSEVPLDVTGLVASHKTARGDAEEIWFLNGAKKSKLEYIAYQSGEALALGTRDAAFAVLDEAVQRIVTAREGSVLPPHVRAMLEVSEESDLLFHRAMAVESESAEEAVAFLERAVETSPGHRDAVLRLAQLLESEGRPEEAHHRLDEFLGYFPADPECLLLDGRILLEAGRTEEAQSRVRALLAADPENTAAQALQEAIVAPRPGSVVVSESRMDAEGSAELVLPFEVAVHALLGTARPTPWVLALGVAAISAAAAGVFRILGDLMMSLTLLSIGVLWGVVFWAIFRIRRILAESRRNFAAFLRSSGGASQDRAVDGLLSPVFGAFHLRGRGFAALGSAIAGNWGRMTTVAVLSALLTVLFFRITQYSTFHPAADVVWVAFCFLFFAAFLYLLTILVQFHRMLRQLRFQRIHFSLVQHPKLSIRYLSHLSRRVSYPLLVIYVLAAFTLYLGPFLANSVFIALLSAFAVFIVYVYYSTIFLVRGVVISNKWRLISQFSVHFDKPFNDLIARGEKKDMVRLKDLIEIRDFIDSMDVWAERKTVLAATSIAFAAVLLFSTIGVSNLMTRAVVPRISAQASRSEAAGEPRAMDLEVPQGQGPLEMRVTVANVDDSVVVCWGDSVGAMADQASCDVGDDGSRLRPSCTDGRHFARCNWSNGAHGTMDLRFALAEEKHVLLLAYNHVYQGFLWMGGGKFSFDIRLFCEGRTILRKRQFVRSNARMVGFVAYLRLRREGNRVHADVIQGPDAVRLSDAGEFAKWLQGRLDAEKDAKAEILAGGGG